MKTVGILIPVANEEKTIRDFTNCLLEECKKLSYDFRIHYIMDSYSKDATQEILEKDFCDDVEVLFHASSTGLVSSYLYGYKHCVEQRYDYVLEMDSGFSHKPEHLKDFLFKLDNGYDAVFGSRFSPNSLYKTTFFRKFVSRFGTIMANFWLGMNYDDATSGYQAFKREVLDDFIFDEFISFGGMFQTEIKFYVFDRRNDYVEEQMSAVELYSKYCKQFFSHKLFGDREKCYRYKICSIPIEFIMSDSSFKTSWIIDAVKILFRLESNSYKVFKKGVKNG